MGDLKGGYWYLLKYNLWVILQAAKKMLRLRVRVKMSLYLKEKASPNTAAIEKAYARYLRSDELATTDGSRAWDSGPLSEDGCRRTGLANRGTISAVGIL